MNFNDIKEGDTVVVSCHPIHGPGLLRTVERVTRTQILVGKDRYNRSTGRRIGDTSSWDSRSLLPATSDLIDRIRTYNEHLRIEQRFSHLQRVFRSVAKREPLQTTRLHKALPYIEKAICVLEDFPAPNP